MTVCNMQNSHLQKQVCLAELSQFCIYLLSLKTLDILFYGHIFAVPKKQIDQLCVLVLVGQSVY